MARVAKVIADGTAYYERLLAPDDGVLLVREQATFSPGGLRVPSAESPIADTPVVIAAGARSAIADIPGIGEVPFLTSDELITAPTLPTSLIVIGGGVIACEFAQALARLGVEVTIAMRGDRPLRGEEPEAREVIARVLAADGVRVVTDATGMEVDGEPGAVRLRFAGGEARAAQLLVATGREPAVADLDSEAYGIEHDRGGILVDGGLATTRPGVFALGDAIGGDHRRYQFTHVATHEGPGLAEAIVGGGSYRPRYHAMPRVTFTDPQVAAVGYTEAQAIAAGHDVLAHVKLVREVGKARAIGETEGFVKIVLDRATGKLLGATIVCGHAGDMISSLTMPLHVADGDLDALLATTFPHPTVSEAVKVAVRNAVRELG